MKGMINRLLYLLYFLYLLPFAMYATGQEGDIIYIDGKQWVLLGKPVYADSVIWNDLRAALPEERSFTTANWDGYTAYWSISQEKLCLDSIKYDLYDKATKKSHTECMPSDIMLRVFKKYNDGNRIVATWFNNDLRVASGKKIYYMHIGYERNYEYEQIISIDHGKLTGKQAYHNYVVEGFFFDHSSPDFQAQLREKFPLHIENYPELANVKRIVFSILRARVNAAGRLVECEVKVRKPADNQPLAAEMEALLKAYHPWRVSYINGEYRANGIEGYTFPYIIEER
jgi:hypothetical protein